MKKYKNIIDCIQYDSATSRNIPFEVAKYVFNYQTDSKDKQIIDNLVKQGMVLAEKVNPGAANYGKSSRAKSTIIKNSISGLLAEFVWLDFISHHKIGCSSTDFTEAKKQIDIVILDNNKKIEVRSSFPRNGLKFALCHNKYQFDVIGPYVNDYKPGEIMKDFYVRTLFPFSSNQLLQRIKQDNFQVFLTGGATWSMMLDDSVSFKKDFIPEDELDPTRLESASIYRVVPFSKALDSFEIINALS